MRGMHFNGANPELREAVHFRTRIGHRPRKHSSERDEAIRSRAAVLCAPVIYFRRESDNLWCDVIDQPARSTPRVSRKARNAFGSAEYRSTSAKSLRPCLIKSSADGFTM